MANEATSAPYESVRQRVLRFWRGMKAERDFYLPTWRDIASYVLPQAARFMPGDTRANDTRRGQSQMDLILNNAAGHSLETGSAGMASSLTNPARPWFRITTADPMLAESYSVRGYCFQVERLVQWVFARSNIHGVLVSLYRNAMAFGTAPMWIDEDEKEVIRAYTLPIGQFALAASYQGRIDTVAREFPMTVRQLLQRFGEDNEGFSTGTKRLIERREWNQQVPGGVLHIVCPNEDLDAGALDGRQMKSQSIWMELGAEDNVPPLKVSGYREFPVMTARWEVNGTDDVYGTGPVHRALPDIKQLQHTEEQKLNLLDKLVSPPLNYAGSLRGDFPSIMAGALNVVPGDGSGKVEPTYAPDVKGYELAAGQCEVLEQRIRKALHEDLWRMLTDLSADNRPAGMTATEVVERHEEKLILLGPVVDRFHNEVLSPLIKRTVSVLAERRMLPPPPDELVQALMRGEDVRIEYISTLAQAQRILGIGSLERFGSIVRQIAETDPTGAVMDKVDRDEVIDQAADMLGIPPNIVRADDAVAEMRISRARNAAAQQQMQWTTAAAQQAAALAKTPMSGDTALSRLLAAQGPSATSATLPPQTLGGGGP
jgi:hypothetical protein